MKASAKATELRRIPLFSRLTDRDREFVASNLEEIDFPAGAVLIREGESNHAFIVLREGEVEVLVAGQPRRSMGPGDFFGEISMVGRVPATASIIAKTAIRTFVASHAQFATLETNQAVRAALRSAISQRLLADRSQVKDG